MRHPKSLAKLEMVEGGRQGRREGHSGVFPLFWMSLLLSTWLKRWALGDSRQRTGKMVHIKQIRVNGVKGGEGAAYVQVSGKHATPGPTEHRPLRSSQEPRSLAAWPRS